MSWLLPALLASQIAGIWIADRLAGVFSAFAGPAPSSFGLGSAAALTLGLAAAAGALASGRRPALRLALALLLAFAAGALGLSRRIERARQQRPAAPIRATVEGRIASERSWPGGGSVVLRHVRSVAGPPVPPGVEILVSGEGGAAELLERSPGSWIRARLRVKAPRGLRNPGGQDRARRLARAGVGGVARLVHPRLQSGVGTPPALQAWLHRLRHGIAWRLEARGPGGALLAALAVGEPGGLPPNLRSALARLGLAHLLAVSGLHLALVAALVLAVARPILARALRQRPLADARRVALGVAVAAAGGYALLTGLGIPVRRALVFLAAWGVVAARGRPTRRGAPLVLAAMLLLAVEPGALFALGAQLSFAATAALLWSREVERPVDDWMLSKRSRLRRHARALVRASASAAAATAPLVAASGRSVSILAGLPNLVAVPLTAVLLLPLALACAAAVALAPVVSVPLVSLAAHLSGVFLAGALAMATRIPSPASAPAAAPALLLAALLGLGAVRARRTGFRVVLAMLAALASAVLPPPLIEPAPPRVVFIDVGQGDAVLVQTPHAVLLVDGGTAIPGGVDLGERIVVPALRALGVRRIDLLVASHADLDHRGGLPAVLRSLPVGRIWLPLRGLADADFAALLEEARRRGIPVEERGTGGAPFGREDLKVTPLWPPAEASSSPSENDGSLVLRVDTPSARVLLPGDIEAPAEQALVARGADLRAEVLKLSHHGSRTSSSSAFLDAVHPRVAVASAPPAGRFGMPHPAVRARLARRHVFLAWTGRDGAVLVGLDRDLRLLRFSVDHEARPLPAGFGLAARIHAAEGGATKVPGEASPHSGPGASGALGRRKSEAPEGSGRRLWLGNIGYLDHERDVSRGLQPDVRVVVHHDRPSLLQGRELDGLVAVHEGRLLSHGERPVGASCFVDREHPGIEVDMADLAGHCRRLRSVHDGLRPRRRNEGQSEQGHEDRCRGAERPHGSTSQQ